MAKQSPKRKQSRSALKRRTARDQVAVSATERGAFPGGSKKTRREVKRVVPPARA